MSTVHLGKWIPKIVNTFGDQTIDLNLYPMESSKCVMTDDTINCNMGISMNLWRNGTEPILDVQLEDIKFEVSLFSMNDLIKGHIDL